MSAAFWMLAQLGAIVHQNRVQHVRCADHGELMELRAADPEGFVTKAVTAEHPALVAPSPHHHDHGCLFAAPLAGTRTPQAQARLTELVAELREAAAHDAPARAPPLSYAPKTSPPAHS